jgi:uncharacterized hydrophobic protein (TIGR00271 family)
MNKFTFRGIIRAVNIKDGSNKEYAIDNLSKGIYIKGANLWYLIASAILASIGLDTNSPAVIIGAMLISPLMSPILGIGLGVGIYDRELLFSSLKEFGFAVLISLLISISYFLISPLGNITSELLSRTTPTILDIGIAVFGGIAGIVAASRKGIVNSIPGVAIATALMPPLCTTGFGIAKGEPQIFLGSFYLFFINAVFISLSVFVVVRYLKFPLKNYLNPVTKSRIRKLVFFVVIVISIPSIVLFYGIIKTTNEQNQIKSFISDNIEINNRNVLSWKLQKYDSLQNLRVFYSGIRIRSSEEDSLKNNLKTKFGNIVLRLQHLDQDYKIETLENKLTSDADDKFQSLFLKNSVLEEKIKSLELTNTFDITDSAKYKRLNLELEILFPFFREISISKDSVINVNVKTDLKGKSSSKERKRIEDFTRLRVGINSNINVK